MIKTETEHFEIVAESLSGHRTTDDQTFSSIAVLSDRLEQLKETNQAFAGIDFSPQVQALSEHEMALALS